LQVSTFVLELAEDVKKFEIEGEELGMNTSDKDKTISGEIISALEKSEDEEAVGIGVFVTSDATVGGCNGVLKISNDGFAFAGIISIDVLETDEDVTVSESEKEKVGLEVSEKYVAEEVSKFVLEISNDGEEVCSIVGKIDMMEGIEVNRFSEE